MGVMIFINKFYKGQLANQIIFQYLNVLFCIPTILEEYERLNLI